MTSQVEFTFRRVLREIKDDLILVPLIRAALLDPSFKGFQIDVEGWSGRAYDGKFHPSTHALWTERQLMLYLTRPDFVETEVMSLTSVLAVTQGSFWHTFYQLLLESLGVLLQAEVPVDHPETNVRGHADGKLGGKDPRLVGQLLELKTMNDWKHDKVTSEAALRELEPGYFAQSQDYMDALGYDQMRYLIIGMKNPYPMTEFVVNADPAFQAKQREKYRTAMQMAAEGDLGQACCPLNSKQAKTCPVRLACPIGKMTAGVR